MPSKQRVLFSLLIFGLFSMALMQTSVQSPGPGIVAGRNVNMVSGPDLTKGDPYLQRQNEPSVAVSTDNVHHLLAGSNDYSTVDMAGSVGELPGAPEGATAGDAWVAVYTSLNGGESWEHRLLPGHPSDETSGSPLRGFDAASDPTVRALKDGAFLYSGIVFDRVENGDSAVFVARYQDIGTDIIHEVTNILAYGTSGQFADKPWIAYDIPRPGYPEGIAYVVYSVFLGQLDQNIHSQIYVARSIDGGKTWEKSTKLSESQQKNQGTTIAIDPNDGTVYVGWRRFSSQSGNELDAMLIAKSENHGKSFTKAAEVSPPGTFFFDQPTNDFELLTTQFRSYAFPTLAVDNAHRVHMAWSERIGGENGEARIVVYTSADGGYTWPYNTYVDDYDEGDCYEFMPSMAFWAGNLIIAWYDTRESYRIKMGGTQGKWITDDYTSEWRHTIDVRAALGIPDNPPEFDPSIQVSRYLFGLNPDNGLVQMQYNPPGYPLFKGGTVSFHGDYLDIAPAPRFIKNGESWRFNKETWDPSDGFVTWTDNRDVRPPLDNNPNINPWTFYNPPNHKDCVSGFHTGMRNQNVYVSKITRGIEIGLLESNVLYQNKQVFAIYIKNNTGLPDEVEEQITFDLNITPPSEGNVSFFPGLPPPNESQYELTVTVPEHSSVSRQIFVEYDGTDPLLIEIQVSGEEFLESIYLNVEGLGGVHGANHLIIEDLGKIDWENPPDLSPIPYVVNPNIVNPNIVNPNIVNPNIVNPNIVNPNIVNPNIVNPNIVNPNIVTPNIVNPNIVNPNIVNPNIVNMSMAGADIVDKFWRVQNTGDVASSYTFKAIAGEPLSEITYVATQLLVYKVHKTPGVDGETCNLLQEVHHELILNITPPNLSPDISTYEKIVDPELTNGWIDNATFSLDPEEEAIVILRVIDTHQPIPSGNIDGSVTALSNGDDFDPLTYADNIGAVAISHSSTDAAEVTAMTLMILPTNLIDGQAGQQYPDTSLRAIGGTEPYFWSIVSGSLPYGMNLDTNGVISGIPKEAGPFSFIVKVEDSSVPDHQYDTQGFALYIAEPPPLEIEMSPPAAPNADKYSDYSGNVTFTASGGLPPYTSWNLSAVNKSTGDPVDLGFTLPSSGNNNETAALTNAPQSAGDFTITVTVTDDLYPSGQNASLPFDLCVKPLPLDIVSDPSPFPEGNLGSSYAGVTLSVSNAEGTPSWDVTGLPSGLTKSSPTGSSIEITGTPEYELGADYPKTFTITVGVTDQFSSSCFTRGWYQETFTITINPKEPVWFFEGTDNGEAKAVTVDSSGNILVTGFTQGESTGKDYYTAMYDALGNLAWEMTYNGPGNGADEPSAIAVDSSGVYVTGTSLGDPTGQDVYTVKYALLDGHVIWEDRHDGPAFLGDGANAMALDATRGSLYVAGWVHRGVVNFHADGCLLKYECGSGELLWEETYDSRRNGEDFYTAIAVDTTGNIIVTGKSRESLPNTETTFDYFTAKYDSSGKMLWEVRDDGPGFGDDEPTAIAVDATGNVCVTGLTTGGTQGADYYTVMYDGNGNPLWGTIGKTYNGIGNGDDVATGIAVDATGNAYVTGRSTGSSGYDYATIKYSSNGTQLWNRSYNNNLENGDDQAVAIAVDGTDIYVTGFVTKPIEGNGEETDFFTLKYNNAGDIMWIAQYDGPSHKDDVAIAMTVNGTGIYVTGFSWKDAIKRVFATVKYEK